LRQPEEGFELKSCRDAAGPILRFLSHPAAALAFALAITPAASQEVRPVLTGIKVAQEGNLVRLTLEGSAGLESFTISRQGPPEKRDLVLTLKGAASAMSATPTDTSGPDPILPFEVTSSDDKGIPTVKIVLPREGDALVRFEHDGGRISFVLIPPEPRKTVTAEAYRIGADDVLAISVFGHDDLTKTTKVSPDGMVNFPLIGNVHAATRTVDDVSAEIQDRLAKDFLVDPHVTVSVWEYLSQWVNVIGEVAKPGRYYMTGPTTIIDAISQAGGLRNSAGEAILVTRRPQESDPGAAGEILRYSTASLLSEEKSSVVVRLRPGDVVNVLAREVFYVSGEIRNPGAYPLERAITLTKALTVAGGSTNASGAATAEVIHEEGGAQQRTTYLLRDIEERKVQDPLLRAGDVVVVKSRS
jgi:polysaccharide export outer membrane protein